MLDNPTANRYKLLIKLLVGHLKIRMSYVMGIQLLIMPFQSEYFLMPDNTKETTHGAIGFGCLHFYVD